MRDNVIYNISQKKEKKQIQKKIINNNKGITKQRQKSIENISEYIHAATITAL
jgi:hypothetical protein